MEEKKKKKIDEELIKPEEEKKDPEDVEVYGDKEIPDTEVDHTEEP